MILLSVTATASIQQYTKYDEHVLTSN